MSNRFSLVVIMVLLLGLCGCRKNEFKVEFSLPDNINTTYTLIYYASDPSKGWIVEQVVPVQKGRAQGTLPTRLPALVYVMASGSTTPAAVFYAERGDDFKISGDSPDPVNWTISGNKITDRLTDWRLASKGAIEAARRDPDSGAAKLNSLVAKYVAEHRDDPVSTILLLTYYNRRADEDGFRKAWDSLEGKAAEQSWLDLVGRTDMWAYGPVPALPKQIVLKSLETGCDTITPGSKPILLYFSFNGSAGRREHIDSLRRLTREFRDSTRRIIADISLENDSIAVGYTTRNDSLTSVIHAWMPLGVSDLTAQSLGLPGVPYVIVIGRNGKTLYRGNDMKKALPVFRRQLAGAER